MKTKVSISLALGLSLVPSSGATSLLPGLRFTEPSTSLRGSLVFLYSTNWDWSAGQGQIYELNLQTKRLRMVTASPGGAFYCAEDGKTFCVLHGANVGWGIFGTNAFIYSEQLHLSRSYTFQERPSGVTFGPGHVFFYLGSHVFDYDIVASSLKVALLPAETTADAESGLAVAVPSDAGHGGFRASDGRWLFFEGPGAPLRGTKLVSSLFDEFQTRFEDPKGKSVRVIKRFSRPLSGSYNLLQLSPCRRYALIRRSFPIGDDWGYTYYVVNALHGQTTALVEDTVPKIPKARVSQIHWVNDPR